MSNGRRPSLIHSIEQVSPKTAKEWLEHNTFNRKVSERLVDVYAEAMSAGEWVLNGEPIIFDKEGKLQSGQHRLLAVLASGTTVWTCVVRGADPAAIFSLDAGRKRRMTDVLTLRGDKDVANLAAALVWEWRYRNSLMDRAGITPTNTHLLTILDETAALRDWIKVAHGVRTRGLRVPLGLLAVLLYHFDEISPDECAAFVEALSTGENLDSTSPVYALRRWILRAQLEQAKPHASVWGAITIKAWNAYRDHQPVRNLRWAANEPFPVIA